MTTLAPLVLLSRMISLSPILLRELIHDFLIINVSSNLWFNSTVPVLLQVLGECNLEDKVGQIYVLEDVIHILDNTGLYSIETVSYISKFLLVFFVYS